ncbi:MAG: hypothetical protein KF727_03460 [Microbacteriaceae bacterium]|nr:hypothetical protein [Microbacteriaceae bacterium]
MEFIERWDRADGELGNGWTDAHDAHPTWWDQLALAGRAPAVPDPDRGLIMGADNAAGRAAFYRDFGPEAAEEVSVSLVWSGRRPLEGTPLLHVNPDADEFGLGAWYFSARSVILVGTAGRVPSQFTVIQQILVEHVHGLRRRIELRSHGDTFSVWISANDVRFDYAADPDLYPLAEVRDGLPMLRVGLEYPIPASLRGATMHGGAIDVNNDWSRAGNTRVMFAPFTLRAPVDRS